MASIPFLPTHSFSPFWLGFHSGVAAGGGGSSNESIRLVCSIFFPPFFKEIGGGRERKGGRQKKMSRRLNVPPARYKIGEVRMQPGHAKKPVVVLAKPPLLLPRYLD